MTERNCYLVEEGREGGREGQREEGGRGEQREAVKCT